MPHATRVVTVGWCLALVVALGAIVVPTAGADIYWGHFAYHHGIGRAGLDGSHPDPAFIPGVPGTYAFSRGVAVDDSHLFWANQNAGSTPSSSFVAPVIARSAADGTDVNQAFTAAAGQSVTGMAVSPAYIYWTFQNQDTGGVGRTPIAGGQASQTIESVFGQPNPAPCGVAVDDTYAYWANRGTASIARAPLASFGDPDAVEGEFIPLPLGTVPCGVALDATHIYWGVYETSTSAAPHVAGTTIGRALKTGDAVDLAFAGGGNRVTGVAVDGDFVYWSNEGTEGLDGAGSIGRVSISHGGADGNFVPGLDSPWGIAVDSRGAPPAPPTPNLLVPVPVTPLPVVQPGGGSGRPPEGQAATRPDFSRVWTTRVVFAPARWSTPVVAKTAAASRTRGTVFNFVLDRAATVTIAIRRRGTGRKLGRTCVARSKRTASKRACRRFTTVAKLTRASHTGLNHVPFSGRIRGKALTPGRYQAVFAARSGRTIGKARRIAFRIVRG
jgi:hypothetical protein